MNVTDMSCVCTNIIASADLREEWFQSHDPMGFIGVDRNANTAAANMHIPVSMFVQPQAPPYYAVSISSCVYKLYQDAYEYVP